MPLFTVSHIWSRQPEGTLLQTLSAQNFLIALISLTVKDEVPRVAQKALFDLAPSALGPFAFIYCLTPHSFQCSHTGFLNVLQALQVKREQRKKEEKRKQTWFQRMCTLMAFVFPIHFAVYLIQRVPGFKYFFFHTLLSIC